LCIVLEEAAPTKKQIICSRSFGERITEKQILREAICKYVTRAAFTSVKSSCGVKNASPKPSASSYAPVPIPKASRIIPTPCRHGYLVKSGLTPQTIHATCFKEQVRSRRPAARKNRVITMGIPQGWRDTDGFLRAGRPTSGSFQAR